MKVIVNDEEQTVTEGKTVLDLITQLGFLAERIVLECNEEILPRCEWKEKHLTPGDRLEIVEFVGGG